jgi:acetoacetate decarboxylase
MNPQVVRQKAFAMPWSSPSYPPGPYRFVDREYMAITYRTDGEALERILPEPLELDEHTATLEFIRTPHCIGLGSYMAAAQSIPVRFRGERGRFTLCMFLDSHPPIVAGREIWGFPQKLAAPALAVERDTLVGRLEAGPVLLAAGSMGYKHSEAGADVSAYGEPGFLLKIMPHVDGSPRICELVRYRLSDVTVKGAWTSPAALSLFPHALAPIADLPVHEVVRAVHLVADLTLGLGEVVHDYLA